MKRRQLLKMIGVGVPSVLIGANVLQAQEVSNNFAIEISFNHGHIAEIPMADLMLGEELSYDIQGESGHPHTLTLQISDIEKILQGERVSVDSSKDAGHTHAVTIELKSLVSK